MYKIFEELLAINNETAYQVYKATGIKTSTFSAWKKGTYKPKIEKLILIANHFGVPVDVFFPDEKEKDKETG